ncbi:MAG: DUF3343 domain-containing protein [Bacilli bacterium]|nr:DUF3343 domain-containing protein [Bacilli bacterium]
MHSESLKLLITFPTISDAIALEKYCHLHNIPGRLIPTPRKYSSGCGHAWCTELDYREDIIQLMDKYQIDYDGIYEYI